MNIDELLQLRKEILEYSIDEDEFISPNSFLSYVIPKLVETKLIESEEINSIAHNREYSIAGYMENESKERLQIFLVDSASINGDSNQILESKKDRHTNLFNAGLSFVKKSFNRVLHDQLQDSDPLALLCHKLASSLYIDQIDVVEFILLSASIAVENRGKEQSTKRFFFEDEKWKVNFTRNHQSLSKEILIQFKLVDIPYLYQVSVSKGNADPLVVNFKDAFGKEIEALKAAEEQHFESYLCVIPAVGLANLYKKESSRLLEKNVRSFLNFKVEANKEMRETIRKYPEKFIAYNNGLTITGSSGDVVKIGDRNFIKSISDFQIVNGGQTTAGIYFSAKDGLDISKINLMAKINIAKDVTQEELDDLITRISLYSNTQTKVSKVDLKTSNQELKRIKDLSRSITAPNTNKWFFDLAKGEFDTLVKLKGGIKKFEKEFPKERRFTKEELGKYYTSWGMSPYLVKLGGVKVFRFFIEDISGDGDKKKAKIIDRDFFEQIIARVILFRELQILYGSGKKAIGQLRSAVVPYAISSLYLYMNGNKNSLDFNLNVIWKNQKLDESMREFFLDLMILINDLIKIYSQSDDVGEYSKKEKLWKDISESKELKQFYNYPKSIKFLKKYGVPKLKTKNNNLKTLDFSYIEKVVKFAAFPPKFYRNIINNLGEDITPFQEKLITITLNDFKLRKDVSKEGIFAIENLFETARMKNSSLLINAEQNADKNLLATFEGILKIYNDAINSGSSIEDEFKRISLHAKAKKVKYSSIFEVIGTKLNKGKELLLSEVYNAMEYYKK